MDDKLIEYLEYTGCGVAKMYGTWEEWLCKEFVELVKGKFDQLPSKSKRMLQLYWISLPNSTHFSDTMRVAREKFAHCIQSVTQACEFLELLNRNPGMVMMQTCMTNSLLMAMWLSG